jgi:TonB family protein
MPVGNAGCFLISEVDKERMEQPSSQEGATRPPSGGSQPVEPQSSNGSSHLDHLLLDTGIEEPWYKSIVASIREAINPPKLPPLVVTSKPVEGTLTDADRMEKPWYASLVENVRDLFSPPKLPPLEVTSKPVEVGTIWGAYGDKQSRSMGAGFLIQIGVIALMFLLFKPIHDAIKKPKDDTIVLLNPYTSKVPAAQKAGGGGGGGQRAPTPAAKGAAPKFAPKQFMPPAVAVPKPKLAVVPTITAPAPEIQANNYDDPLSKMAGNSGGQGINGFGDGKGGGVGKGNGDGLGDGEGGGSGGGVYRAGGEVSSPQLITKVEPEYSEEARKAKYSGVVRLSVTIDEHGVPMDIKVTGPLGLGLDEKAVEAVQKWRFRPGLRNGKPVKVRASIEVSFRLL